jgi:hypothetical protein
MTHQFLAQEIWYYPSTEKQDVLRRQTATWIEEAGGEVLAFDFPTKEILQAALVQGQLSMLNDSNGGAPGVIGLKPGNAVTFIDNHDTGNQNLSQFQGDKVMQGYVYILTHPGIPSVVSSLKLDLISRLKICVINVIFMRLS